MDNVVKKSEIEVYSKFEEQIKSIEENNNSVVFDYESKKGSKEAKSHIYKMRQSKTAIKDAHKLAKAESKAYCDMLDKGKRELIDKFDSMILVHSAPLDKIKERDLLAIEAAKLIEEIIKDHSLAIELDFIFDEKKRNEDIAIELAKKEAEIERENREKEIARIAYEKASKEAEEKLRLIEREVEEDKRKAEEKRLRDIHEIKRMAEEKERKANEDKRKAEEKRRLREEDLDHRRCINNSILSDMVGFADISPYQAKLVITSIIKGLIKNIKIEY